jgi:hypothetical protein
MIIIFWRGYGIFVLIIAAACLVTAQLVADGATGDPNYYKTHNWLGCLALFVAAVPVHFMGNHLNHQQGRRDSLFFIPMQYWAIILPVIGLCYLFGHLAQN